MKDKLYHYRATLLATVDGDTVDLNVDLGFRIYQHMRIRLLGYDAPEMHGGHWKVTAERLLGIEARDILRKSLEGKELILRTQLDSKDKYGRILGDIYAGDIHVNDIMSGVCKTMFDALRTDYPNTYA